MFDSTFLRVLVLLAVLIFVHELGHYFAARLCGVRVKVFSLGFGPELFSKEDRHGTKWRLALIPLGGYVRMLGDMNAASFVDEDSVPVSERPYAFPFKKLWQRAFIVFAGPLANFVFALLVLFFVSFLFPSPVMEGGKTKIEALNIAQVLEGTPAQEAGLLSGDKVLSVDGQKLVYASDFSGFLSQKEGQPVSVVIERAGLEGTYTLNPKKDLTSGTQRWIVGVQLQITPQTQKLSALGAAFASVRTFSNVFKEILGFLGKLISFDKETAAQTGSLGSIYQMTSYMVTLSSFLSFMALISINLGLFNLLPVPILDGGHLLFYGIEAIQRKPLSKKQQESAFMIGLFLILFLFGLSIYNDVIRLVK